MGELVRLRCLRDVGLEIYHFQNLQRPFPGHFHEGFLLGCILQGRRKFALPHINAIIVPGSLVYLPPYMPHSCLGTTAEPAEWLCIHAQCCKDVPAPAKEAIVTDAAWTSRFVDIAKESCTDRILEGLTSLLGEITTKIGSGSTLERKDCCVGRPGSGKDELLGGAGKQQINKFRFLRQFRKCTGLTPGRFKASLRVIQARQFILAGATLAEAARDFCDQSHLNRVFKKQMGVTPGQWRDAREDWQ